MALRFIGSLTLFSINSAVKLNIDHTGVDTWLFNNMVIFETNNIIFDCSCSIENSNLIIYKPNISHITGIHSHNVVCCPIIRCSLFFLTPDQSFKSICTKVT